jgi:hypothetical protein
MALGEGVQALCNYIGPVPIQTMVAMALSCNHRNMIEK